LSSGMTQTAAQMEAAVRRRLRLWALALAALLLLSAGLAWLWTGIGEADRLRALNTSESEITATRAVAISSWLERQQAVVEAVAANPTLVPYLATAGAKDATAQGLAGYLRSYLLDTATREGFLRGTSEVKANTARPDAPGLALLAADGTVLVSAGGPMPPATDLLARRPGALVSDSRLRLASGPVIRWLKPVTGSSVYVYAVRLIDDDVRALLAQPGEAAGTAEMSLISGTGDKLFAITARGATPGGQPLGNDPLVRAALASAPATAQARDAAGQTWLVTARPLKQAGWTVLRARPAGQLLGDLAWRRWLLLSTLLSGLALAGTLILFAWRNAVSVRIAEGAAREEQLRRFLATVTDRQPTGIYVVTGEDRLRFINATASQWQDDRAGEATLASALGEAATAARALVQDVRLGSAISGRVEPLGARKIRLEACLLDPAQSQGDVLLVAEDLTALLAERERREASLAALVHVLTGLIDARDPGSRGHSEKVSRVAAAIAAARGMAWRDVEALATAGELVNIGKILVPRSLLTKATPLTPDEIATVRAAMARSSELLKPVPFEGPVAAWIDQMDAADAPEPSRILRLANGFVGMVSPRAHRPAMSIEAALAALAGSAPPEDQANITALRFWLDTKGGRDQL
jgi:hypothetical protein